MGGQIASGHPHPRVSFEPEPWGGDHTGLVCPIVRYGCGRGRSRTSGVYRTGTELGRLGVKPQT